MILPFLLRVYGRILPRELLNDADVVLFMCSQHLYTGIHRLSAEF